MKLIDSTTFQLLVLILFIAAVASFNGKITWLEWLDHAMDGCLFYAGKESFKYGAAAYEKRNV